MECLQCTNSDFVCVCRLNAVLYANQTLMISHSNIYRKFPNRIWHGYVAEMMQSICVTWNTFGEKVCVCERTNWTMKHWSRIRDKHEWITVFCHLVCCVRLPAIRLLSIVDMQTQMKMRLIDYPVCPCHCLFLHEWWSLSQKNRHLVRSAKFSGCHMTLNHAK